MSQLSEVYNTMGQVMSVDVRQRLANLRTSRNGQPGATVPATATVPAWGLKAPVKPKSEPPVLAVYCAPCAPATPTLTTPCSEELCECVSVALKGGVCALLLTDSAAEDQRRGKIFVLVNV